PRTSPVHLLLYSVYHIGSPLNNLRWDTYEYLRERPSVEWAVPIALGDSHRGSHVIATTQEFFQHVKIQGREMRLLAGEFFRSETEVVLGAEVARKWGYSIGDGLTLTHGLGHSLQEHGEHPFKISGIMAPTGTAYDRALYIDLDAMDILHQEPDAPGGRSPGHKRDSEEQIGHKDGHDDHAHKDGHDHAGHTHTVTAVLLGAKSKIHLLSLQRDINNFEEEPIMGILPGATLMELWDVLRPFERALRGISWVSLFSSLVTLLLVMSITLQMRTREFAVLRSVGAGPGWILRLIVGEGLLTGWFAFVCALAAVRLAFMAADYIVGLSIGFALEAPLATGADLRFFLLMTVGILVFSVMPGIVTLRRVLSAGLEMKV
ncbi:MAG: ABC transporter permease, partial [Deltaproteobacteria bacterium]|nr:ABC transporter permease [Deltaproteobacteria bacterium]